MSLVSPSAIFGGNVTCVFGEDAVNERAPQDSFERLFDSENP